MATLTSSPSGPEETSTAAVPTDAEARRRSNRRWWTIVLLLTLLGVAVRVGYIYGFRNDPRPIELNTGDIIETRLWGDGFVFHHQANLIAEGEGLIAPIPFYIFDERQQSADHPPLYTAYLTAFSLAGIKGDLSHMLLSAPAGAAAVVAFAILGRRVGGDLVGLLAGAYGAIAPSLISYPGFLLSETIVVPLAALAAHAVYRFMAKPTINRALWMGAAVGLGVLARAELAFYVLVVVIPVILIGLRSIDFRQRLVLLVATGITCGAIVLPWVGYNLNRFEEPLYMSVGLEYSLVQGNCDESYSDDFLGYYWLGCMGEALEGQLTEDGESLEFADQSLGASYLRDVAVDYIKDHPRRATMAVGARLGRLTGVFHPIQQARLNALVAGREPWLANLSVLVWYPSAVLAAIGAVLLKRRGVRILPLVGLVVVALAAVAMTLAVLRYRATMEPAIAVFAAVAIARSWDFLKAAWTDEVTASV
jgi:4-amino-4-deoxy-L-arabinose transferase-like glycosyltransferase